MHPRAATHRPVSPPPPERRLALSVVAPCHNEALCLDEFAARLQRSIAQCGLEHSCEIILVNDGSTDATWERITAIAAADARVVGVDLSRNHGHQLAVTAGLSLCRGEHVLLIDADLQDPPELLCDMLELLQQGADVVYGKRISRAGESWAKKLEAKAFYRFLDAMTEVPIPLDTGDFRLMRRRVVEVLQAMPERHRFIRGMVSWVGFTQVPLLYHRDPRYAGETKYTLRKMVAFATDAITGFSIRPLRFASYGGVAFSLLGLALLAYVFSSYFFGFVVPGWASILGVLLVLGSCQLFVLGLAGEYIGRIYMQSKGRPLFIIRSVVNGAYTGSAPSKQADYATPVSAYQGDAPLHPATGRKRPSNVPQRLFPKRRRIARRQGVGTRGARRVSTIP